MARKKDKQKAIVMRNKGMSYSQIKEKLGISKSTLSGWLYNMPLSEKRIRELQADNPVRIERYRNTMRAKREKKFANAYQEMSLKIKKLSSRELFLAGLFLYWGEGSKTTKGTVGLTNTNPTMLKFYINWLKFFGYSKKDFSVHLHLYSDMNIKRQEKYWSRELDIPLSQFRKSYIKKTLLTSITYHNGFGQGTCTVMVLNARFYEKVLMGLKYIQDSFCKL
jgi:transcriptional regulator with XRE-family HTH domain